MVATGPVSYRGITTGALIAAPMTRSRRYPEMNGTTHGQVRSVQLVVMAAPSASVAEAVAEARRRHDTSGSAMPRQTGVASIRAQVAPA